MFFRFLLFVFPLLVAGCVTDAASSYIPATASGKPEVTIKAPVATIKSTIISGALNQGLNVTKDSDYILQLEKPTKNFGAAVLLGSKYDTIPNERYVFTFAQINDSVRVVVSPMFVTNPGSAFEQLTPITNGQGLQKTQQTLDELKYRLESAQASPLKPASNQKSAAKKK